MAERDFAIRLSAKGMEQVRAALKGMGAEGAAGLKQIEAASRQATPAMKSVDTAAKDIRKEFDRLADQVPVFGGALKALGPAGIAAGAALAAIGAGAKALWDQAQKAREALDQIKTSADNIGTSAETFQVLEAAALEADIGVDKLTEAMGKLRLSSALASKGKGELAETLKKLNPELLREITLAETQEDRWNIVSRAITNQTSETEKIIIAKAAFGEQGGKLVRLLDGEGKTMDALTAKYRELGLVIDEKLVQAIAEADRRMDLANKRMEIDGVRAGAAMVPVIEAISGAWNGAWIELGTYLDGMNAVEARSMATLERNIETLKGKLHELTSGETQGALNRMLFGDIRETGKDEAQRIRGEIADLNRELQERRRTFYKGPADTNVAITDLAEEERKKAEAARLAAEALRAQQALEKQAIAIRKEAGDWSGVYAQKVAELDAVVGKYGVTQEMVNGILLKYRHELDGTAEAQARWSQALAAAEHPTIKLQKEIKALWDDFSTGAISTELFEQNLARLTKEMSEAEKAALNALIANSDWADGSKAAAAATDKARESTLEYALTINTTSAILRGQMKDWSDWKDVALDAIADVISKAIEAQSQIKGSSLLDYGSAILGAFGFGGGAAPAAGTSSIPVPLPIPGKMHTGGVVGDPTIMPVSVPMSLFSNAPRFHGGLAPDEFPTILQRGERVLSASHNERMVRAIEGGGSGGGKMEVHIHPPSGYQAETREQAGADGGRSLEVSFVKMVDGAIAQGAGKRTLTGVYGLKPQVVG